MLLSDDAVSVFIDGTLSDPQLDHPEGLAIHPDGSIWCGGERGQIFRVDPEGGELTEVASTGGVSLGLANFPQDGATAEEALANAQDAIQCWIEAAEEMGRSVPEPKRVLV